MVTHGDDQAMVRYIDSAVTVINLMIDELEEDGDVSALREMAIRADEKLSGIDLPEEFRLAPGLTDTLLALQSRLDQYRTSH